MGAASSRDSPTSKASRQDGAPTWKPLPGKCLAQTLTAVTKGLCLAEKFDALRYKVTCSVR